MSTTACRLRPLTPAFAGAGSSWLHHSPPDRSGAPPFSPFHALAVHDGRRGAGLLAGQLAGLLVESMVEPPQRAVTLPAHEVVMHGAARGQVLGQGAPLAACAQDVEHRIEHLAQISPALPARPALRDVHEGAGQLPFCVGHVRGVPQALAVVSATGLSFPHRRVSSKAAPAKEPQVPLQTQPFSGPALRLLLRRFQAMCLSSLSHARQPRRHPPTSQRSHGGCR